MERWVLLLRGINVGGHGTLPMADLRVLLADMGAEDVQTYIQSGNVVARGTRPDGAALMDAVAARFGFRRECLVLSAAEFTAAMAACPFEPAEGKHLHVWFTGDAVPGDLSGLLALAAADEALHIGPQAVYLHAPGGIGRSKLAEALSRHLPRHATARNWNTILKLRDMLANG